jgi:hypothetical protein
LCHHAGVDECGDGGIVESHFTEEGVRVITGQ